MAWLEAVAASRGVTRAAVVREAIVWLAGREATTMLREGRMAAIAAWAKAEAWNPISDHLSGNGKSAQQAQRAPGRVEGTTGADLG